MDVCFISCVREESIKLSQTSVTVGKDGYFAVTDGKYAHFDSPVSKD